MINVASAVSSAAAVAANDTASNSSRVFHGVAERRLAGGDRQQPAQVNFTVFSDGAVKLGLTTTNVSFALAKLVPGATGNPDQWVNYIYRTENGHCRRRPERHAEVLASAKQATTDTAKAATQLVYTTPTVTIPTPSARTSRIPPRPTGWCSRPGLTHRVAIQLSYTNKAGETVLVNPYFDFTVDANGNAVAVADASKTRKMTDVNSCNTCHAKLRPARRRRVDTQYCVMCHNSGTTDANSGNVLDLRTMAHKIHSGRRLMSKGEDYTIWGYRDTKYDYAEVGFPQDLRNCSSATAPPMPALRRATTGRASPPRKPA